MLVDLSINGKDGNPIAEARNMRIERACEQLVGWLEQGLSVVIVEAHKDKDEEEIIQKTVLDID